MGSRVLCPGCGERQRGAFARVWQPRICPACGAKWKHAMTGRIIAGSVMLASIPVGLLAQVVTGIAGTAPMIQGVFVLAGSIVLLISANQTYRIDPGPFCSKCGYPASDRGEGAPCPECGAGVEGEG